MHALVHLITRSELDSEAIEKIMEPFWEEKIFTYNPEKDEYDEPEVRPQFQWDYYTIMPKVMYEKPEDCYVLMDISYVEKPDMVVIARKWWNGKKYVDQTKKFEAYVKRNRKKWKGCWMWEMDIHW